MATAIKKQLWYLWIARDECSKRPKYDDEPEEKPVETPKEEPSKPVETPKEEPKKEEPKPVETPKAEDKKEEPKPVETPKAKTDYSEVMIKNWPRLSTFFSNSEITLLAIFKACSSVYSTSYFGEDHTKVFFADL